jgi:hypothetical protein
VSPDSLVVTALQSTSSPRRRTTSTVASKFLEEVSLASLTASRGEYWWSATIFSAAAR